MMDNDHVCLRPQEQSFPELEMCFLDSHRFGRCRIGDGIIIAHDAAGSGWFGRPRYTGHRRQSGGSTRRARCCGFRFPRLILFHFPVFLGSLGGFRPGLGRGIHMLIDTGYARRIGRAFFTDRTRKRTGRHAQGQAHRQGQGGYHFFRFHDTYTSPCCCLIFWQSRSHKACGAGWP